jgi:hypothetical protein
MLLSRAKVDGGWGVVMVAKARVKGRWHAMPWRKRERVRIFVSSARDLLFSGLQRWDVRDVGSRLRHNAVDIRGIGHSADVHFIEIPGQGWGNV